MKRSLLKRSLVMLAFSLPVLPAPAQNNSAAANVIRPGDNLVLENLPTIPAAIADKAAQYSEVRTALIEDWDPVRKEMLIVTRFADVPQVHAVKMPGGARTQLTFFPDRVSGRASVPRATILCSRKISGVASGFSITVMISPTETLLC